MTPAIKIDLYYRIIRIRCSKFGQDSQEGSIMFPRAQWLRYQSAPTTLCPVSTYLTTTVLSSTSSYRRDGTVQWEYDYDER